MPKRAAVRERIPIENLGWIEFDALSKRLEYGDVAVPAEMSVTFAGDNAQPRLEMRLGIENGKPQCREIRLVAKDGQRGVLTQDLEMIRLGEWTEDLFTMAATQVKHEDGVRVHRVPDFAAAAAAMREARRGARKRISDAQLAEVAEVARRNPKASTLAVADHFGVSHRSATTAKRRAEAAGHRVQP